MILAFSILCILCAYGVLSYALTVQAKTTSEIPAQIISVVTKAQVKDHITSKAKQAGLSVSLVTAIAECESGFDKDIVGDHGNSYGVFQIHLPSHPNITKAQALDPIWATAWAIEKMKSGKWKMWSCYSMVV